MSKTLMLEIWRSLTGGENYRIAKVNMNLHRDISDIDCPRNEIGNR